MGRASEIELLSWRSTHPKGQEKPDQTLRVGDRGLNTRLVARSPKPSPSISLRDPRLDSLMRNAVFSLAKTDAFDTSPPERAAACSCSRE